MSKSAFTIKVFAIYLVALGLGLLLVPNLLLSLFGMPQTSEVWIRVAGVLLLNIGIYYWYAAQSEAKAVFQASIFTRLLIFVAFVAFVILGFASPVLILFGAVDGLGAIWTFFTLKNEK